MALPWTKSWWPLCVLPGIVGLLGGAHAQNVNPADYGVNCTQVEFANLYLSCFGSYEGSEAIKNCEVQCSLLDDVTDCVRRIPKGVLSRECLTSLSDVMVTEPRRLKELLFDVDEVNSCGLVIDSALTVCPELPSLFLPDWSPWGEFGDCNENCTEVRSRECLNVLSFRPPEPAEGCEGESSESRPCAAGPCIVTTASVQGTQPPGTFTTDSSAGGAPSHWHSSDYVLRAGAIVLLSTSVIWSGVTS